MRIWRAAALALTLAGCVQTASPIAAPNAARAAEMAQAKAEGKRNAQMFVQTVAAVAPVAKEICLEKQIVGNCDFQIFVDPRLRLPENAYQTVDYSGRPLIGFTLALLSDARDADEIAFVMGHEAAHHILGHLAQQAQTGPIPPPDPHCPACGGLGGNRGLFQTVRVAGRCFGG